MLIGLTEAMNNNAVYMKNMEFRFEEVLKETLRGQIRAMDGVPSLNLHELISENTSLFD